MTSAGMKKAPAATGAISNQNNQFQGVQMSNIIRQQFHTRIRVAGLTVAPNALTGGDQPDAAVVTLRATGLQITLTPAEACALAAALQAVAVHQMEQTQEVAA